MVTFCCFGLLLFTKKFDKYKVVLVNMTLFLLMGLNIFTGKMDIIPIVLQHGGYWDENSSYVNFKVCGLLIPMNCEYNNLVGMICNELKIQPETTLLKIEYQVKDGYPPFNIVDDL